MFYRCILFFFFFSSRRRHTRLQGDWSSDVCSSDLVIGNNALVVDAAAAEARRLGYRAEVLTRGLQGEAREVARELVARARTLPPRACLIAGGETTVTVGGRGRGGRCQEFVLAAALELRPDDRVVVLAAGTDGTDGPTDAAGRPPPAAKQPRRRRARPPGAGAPPAQPRRP